jgi:hypothetical protein
MYDTEIISRKIHHHSSQACFRPWISCSFISTKACNCTFAICDFQMYVLKAFCPYQDIFVSYMKSLPSIISFKHQLYFFFFSETVYCPLTWSFLLAVKFSINFGAWAVLIMSMIIRDCRHMHLVPILNRTCAQNLTDWHTHMHCGCAWYAKGEGTCES